MDVPLKITYQNVNKTPELESLIHEQASKLEKVCDHIISCRVAVEKPHEHPSSGNPYIIKIEMNVPPGHELAIKHGLEQEEMHTPLQTVIRNAFGSARMELESLSEIQQKDVKTHHPTPDELENEIMDDQADEILEDEWSPEDVKRKLS